MQLATSAPNETPELVSRLLRRARQEPDCERAEVIVELMEEVLIRRFHNLDRVEIRRIFKLHDIRKTRVWQEALEEGIEKGRALEKRQLAARLRADGRTLKEIAHLMEISVAEVRRLIGS
jgi:predicted transposase YdaD